MFTLFAEVTFNQQKTKQTTIVVIGALRVNALPYIKTFARSGPGIFLTEAFNVEVK